MNDKEGRKWLLQKLYDNGIKYIAYSPFYGGYVGVKEMPIISGKGEVVNDIKTVITLHGLLPDFNEPNYLDIGRYLGIVDWSKVAVDTPIKVQRGNGVVVNRHFATYDNCNVYYYQDGRTSWSNVGTKSVPAKRAILEGGNNEN
jgi:hypothetical protein|nr:MAG TPA: hypothetical protein [Caudoviricetes sp.]